MIERGVRLNTQERDMAAAWLLSQTSNQTDTSTNDETYCENGWKAADFDFLLENIDRQKG